MCQRALFDHTAFDVVNTVLNYKSLCVEFGNFRLKLLKFQSRNNRIQHVDILFPVTLLTISAPTLQHRNTTAHLLNDSSLYIVALSRDNDHACILFDTVDYKVDDLRGDQISKDRVKSRLDIEQIGGDGEDENIQNEDKIADS